MALSFGVEIELLICPRNRPTFRGYMDMQGWDPQVESVEGVMASKEVKKKQARNRDALRFAIASSLTAVGIPATSKASADYLSWTILDEPSLDEIPQYWRVEIVSRILSSHTDWREELETIFEVLHFECEVRLTTGCSMHVHVSPFESEFTAEQLRGLCKGLCYFDDAITRVMPMERKENTWAASNVAGRGAVVNQKLRRAYSLVPSKSWAQLFKMLDKVTPKSVFRSLSGTDSPRYLSWNFENITEPCGTVEFRRPPGVDSAAGASHWAAFTLGFVAQAMAAEADWTHLESLKTVGSVGELRAFVAQGLAVLGDTCSGNLNPVVEDTSPPAVLTRDQLKMIELKMKAKDKAKSAFVVKANSRPNSPANSQGSTPTLGFAPLAAGSGY